MMRASPAPRSTPPGNTDCTACHDRLCVAVSADQRFDCPTVITLKRGQRLAVDAGDHRRLWIVVTGTAAVCTCLEDGRRQIVGLELPGDFISGALTAPGSESWLEALTEIQVCEVDMADLARCADEPGQVLGRLLELFQDRIEHFALHIVTLGRLDGMERICLFLSEMARRIGIGEGPTRRVSLALSREDIADYLGLNAETVSRLFGRLKKSGSVQFLSPTELVITDMAALEGRLPVPTVEQRRDFAAPDPAAVLAAQGAR